MSIAMPDARELSDDTLQQLRLRALRGIELGYSGKEKGSGLVDLEGKVFSVPFLFRRIALSRTAALAACGSIRRAPKNTMSIGLRALSVFRVCAIPIRWVRRRSNGF